MATRSFIRTLEVKLDEAFFVFWHLPKQLTSASKRLGLNTMRSDVLARARLLQAHATKLLAALQQWGGRRPRPCDCADLATELNDLRHAAKSPAPDRWLYTTALRISSRLSQMVQQRLEQARRLAVMLGEQGLAAALKELLDERRHATAQLDLPQSDSPDGT